MGFTMGKAVWGAPRQRGVADVLAGWKRILGNGQRLRVKIAQQSTITAMTVAVHSVHELISIEGEGPAKHPVVATNVYQRTAAGWRMIAHHASPAAGQPAAELPTFAQVLLDNFAGAMMGYAEIGRLLKEAHAH